MLDYRSVPNTCLGFVFCVFFYGFYHAIHHHVSPPFGRICLELFPSIQQANSSNTCGAGWMFFSLKLQLEEGISLRESPSILEGQNFNPFHVLSDAHLHLCVAVAEGSIVGILISI